MMRVKDLRKILDAVEDENLYVEPFLTYDIGGVEILEFTGAYLKTIDGELRLAVV